MLYFRKNEVTPIRATEKAVCSCCVERLASWETQVVEGDRAPVCAWCLLYSMETEWGQANREELSSVGRGAQAMAGHHGRELPDLDDRHRLSPGDAEKFVAGVYATSRALRGPLGRFSSKHVPR